VHDLSWARTERSWTDPRPRWTVAELPRATTVRFSARHAGWSMEPADGTQCHQSDRSTTWWLSPPALNRLVKYLADDRQFLAQPFHRPLVSAAVLGAAVDLGDRARAAGEEFEKPVSSGRRIHRST
jgi:hypothetical protein